MTITGSIGPRSRHEAIGEDFELPQGGYYESCAACGLAQFAQRMWLLERRGESLDVLERVLYNAVLHGIALDGTASYYTNPLRDQNRQRDNSWVCCPPNLSRTLLQVGRFAYAVEGRDVFVNLYVGGSLTVPRAGGSLVLRQRTDYPWKGSVAITVRPPSEERFALHLRIPGWCRDARVRLNGESVATEPLLKAGFVRLERSWRPGDVVELTLAMPIERVEAHPNIRECAGRVALQRGPLVYGVEGLDNEGVSDIELGADPALREEFVPALLGGVVAIRGLRADGRPFTAVPFYALANRGKTSQNVWIVQKGLVPSDAWWLGRLYRPLPAANNR